MAPQLPLGSKESGSSMFSLELLESDDTPTFIIQVGITVLQFEVLYANRDFRERSLGNVVLSEDREARLFRSWAQTPSQHDKLQYGFAGFMWSAQVAPTNSTLKAIRATRRTFNEQTLDVFPHESKSGTFDGDLETFRTHNEKQSHMVHHDELAVLRRMPRANVTARWEWIQKMMEISDVGVCEYDTEGHLMHANEAWYRASSQPKDPMPHRNFLFMDLVCAEDRPILINAWNTLMGGSPITIEFRWKPPPGESSPPKWMLSTCVPIFDEDSVLVSIAASNIDISAQKKVQEATQARVEALEQARASEMKFTRLAQLSPTAIYIFVPNVGMQFYNEHFFELTGYTRTPIDQFRWSSLVADEDISKVEADWAGMLQGQRSNGLEFRLKKTWVDQDGVTDNIWVQSSSSPQLDEQGGVLSIMGILFDISHFKWAESVQHRRIEEALEAKRQQENFIDMTSHELRNPISAVVQCAESGINTLYKLRRQSSPTALASTDTDVDSKSFAEDLESTIDSLRTIITCSLHQKRVVDDVLTLSKLDSELITITPVNVQPAIIILDSMKIFQTECRQLGIELDLRQDETAKDFVWVMLDPSRIMQILINLLTNAIKFTKGQPTRKITVEFGGSWDRPPKVWKDVTFTTDGKLQTDAQNEPEWGSGTKAYLWIKVKDSGCGMTEPEQKNLFARFTQASPKTHITYGGSGLGLFICKTLVTMHGGAIGVFSEKNAGSTFAFYVGTRVCEAPTDQTAHNSPKLRPEPGGRTMSFENAMKAIKLRVLVVEDNLVNQRVLKKQLQKLGWTVHVAGDGQEALDWLSGSACWREKVDVDVSNKVGEESDPDSPGQHGHELDLILLDIEMPVLDGLACARQIRDWENRGFLAHSPTLSRSPSSPPGPVSSNISRRGSGGIANFRLPILAVTANARIEQIQEALRAGMDDAITKPFRVSDLWPKIQRLLPGLTDEHGSAS